MIRKERFFSTWASSVADFMFPRICHICSQSLSKSEHYVCTSCLSNIPRTLFHRNSPNPMEDRFAGIIPIERASGHFFYSRGSELSELMQDLKYRYFPGLARELGRVMARELLPAGFFNGIDFVIPVPIHFLKRARRGYNQTEFIATGVSDETGIPVETRLRAVRPHRTQTSLTLAERHRNTNGVFRLSSATGYDRRGILLLDDVCTTGSTLIAAAEAILSVAPEARISMLTLGVTF